MNQLSWLVPPRIGLIVRGHVGLPLFPQSGTPSVTVGIQVKSF